MPHFQVLSSAILYTSILETAQRNPTAVTEQSSTIQEMEVINLELKDFNKMNKKESLQGGRTKRQNSSFSIKSHTLYALGNNKFNSQLINCLPPESAFEMTHNCHIHKPRVSKSHSALPHAAQRCCEFSLPAHTNTTSQGTPCPPKVMGTWTQSPQDTGARNSFTAAAHPQTAAPVGSNRGRNTNEAEQCFLGWGRFFSV